VKEGHLFSRIHVDDIVRLCQVLVDPHGAPGLFDSGPAAVINCCDSDPAPQHEVSAFAYELLGRPVPPAIPFDSAELSAMQKSFYEESRHMVNSKLIEIVGELNYPSYHTGLPASLEEERRLSRPGVLQRLLAPAAFLASAGGRIISACAGEKPVRIALVDNGSLKAEATLSLRRLAADLEASLRSQGRNFRVEAVSARFAERIPAREVGGVPAEILPGWLKRVSAERRRRGNRVLMLPLLIGPSNTLTKTMPDAALASPDLDVEICPTLVCLCPVLYGAGKTGAEVVADMLADGLTALGAPAVTNGAAGGAGHGDEGNDCVMLCDHGSPVARVARAREAVRKALEHKLGQPVAGICMERREGPEFDFNGPLLEDALLALPTGTRVRVALLFLQEGRHAGPGGDIVQIIQGVLEQRPDLSVQTTKVLAGHKALISLLAERVLKSVSVRLFH